MLQKPTSKQIRPKPKAALRLLDFDQAKSAVLNPEFACESVSYSGFTVPNQEDPCVQSLPSCC
jgi:hypothetical protein